MNNPASSITVLPPSRRIDLDRYLAGMRQRDTLASILCFRLDIEVLKAEFAVDVVFARHNYEPAVTR